MQQEWVVEDRGDLIHSLLKAYGHSQGQDQAWARRFRQMEQEKLITQEIARNEQVQDTAARVIQRSWRVSKKREIKQKAAILEQQSKTLDSELASVSVHNGYLMVKGSFADIVQTLGDVSKAFLDPDNEF